MAMTCSTRKRLAYVVLIALVAAAGLTARAIKRHHPILGDIAGDALWATMAFCLISFVWPTATLAWRVLAAIAISFAVEFSQIYHAHWIDRIRRTTSGAMILGSSFDWRDLICYVVGVTIGAVTARVSGIDR
jgi:hypothetical protein